jgi:hypothetical protein
MTAFNDNGKIYIMFKKGNRFEMKNIEVAMKIYTSILNEYPAFNSIGNIDFEFQNVQDEILIKLKNDFSIGDVAIGKSDFEKTLSLMAYVHNELFYPGDNISPKENNTYEIMKVRKTGALFCSFHATVLSEMLLSVGIKAINIFCIPKDFDYDRHVAILAYMEDVKKWVFFDPTFNTYFFDKNKNPLGIFEIREQYRNLKDITFKHIEIDKQWTLVMNGLMCDTYDDWYKIYMAKNCFRFMFPKKSEFNYSKDSAEYIFINPIDYNINNEYDAITSLYRGELSAENIIKYTNYSYFG